MTQKRFDGLSRAGHVPSARRFVLPGDMVGYVQFSASALAQAMREEPSAVEEALASYLLAEGIGLPSPGERRSWDQGLRHLAADLNEAGLGDIEVILEYRLPLSSQRADAILAGRHPKTGEASYVVVELKQWAAASALRDSPLLVEVPGIGYGPLLHPLAQAEGYARYLQDFLPGLSDGQDPIDAIAYLPNASSESTPALTAIPGAEAGRFFTGTTRPELQEYLRGRLAPERGESAARALPSARAAPSKELLALASAELQEREQFVLLADQRRAYELVLDAVRVAGDSGAKSTIVVAGAPGTGKSVIALSLVGELARQGRTVLHATGSRAFTQTMRQVAGRGSSRVKSLFKYFNSFMGALPDGVDVLVLDEAHRLREKSVNRYTPKSLRESARPQLDELLDAAKVTVFLLDQHQVVRPGEMGTIDEIEARVRSRGARLRHIDLNAQFRAGGSVEYLSWVRSLLGLGIDSAVGPAPHAWFDEADFVVDVVDSPAEMENRLRARHERGETARMTAGFCWPWSEPTRDGRLVADVQIGSWSRPWNLKGERRVGEAPPSSLWASDPGGFDQVGCIYTAQGFEYSHNGVIFGPDLVWRGDRWIARREFSRDPDFRRGVDDATFDRLIRNVYKVLLTRGLRSTLLFSTDAETQAMLKQVVNPPAV